MAFKVFSRLSIISLLLFASSEHSPTTAMDIVDESTHEQVFSSEDGADIAETDVVSDNLSDEMQDAIDEDQEPAGEVGTEPVLSVIDGKEKEGDYVEESDTPDGHHIRKEVHQGPGFKTVRITTNGGSGPVIGGGRGPSIMQAMMQDMMQQMAHIGQPPRKEDKKDKVMEMNGPMGRIVVRKRIPFDEDDDHKDDHEEDGIPPEILDMIRMTEMMQNRARGGIAGSPFGRPAPAHRQLQIQKDKEEDKVDRHEESHDDIMARMNKLSEDIGERHDRDKMSRLQEKQSSRFIQVLAVTGFILLIMLVSFIVSCRLGKAKGVETDDDDQIQNSNKRVGKAD